MNEDNNKSSVANSQSSVVSPSTKLGAGGQSSDPPADNSNTANPPASPASPAIDDAPLPFGLKPPGSDEAIVPTTPAAPAVKPASTEPVTETPPSAKATIEASPLSAKPAMVEQPVPTTTVASRPAAATPTAPPPSPPQQTQVPKKQQSGFLKNIFKRKTGTTPPPSAKAPMGSQPASVPPAPALRPVRQAQGEQGSGQAPQIVGKAAIIRRPVRRAVLVLEIFAGILVSLAAIFLLFFYRAQININPTPLPDKILLDQREVKAGNFKVKPGVHSIEIKKEDYVTYRLTTEFKINQKMTITMPLIRATEPQAVLSGGTDVKAAASDKLVFFLTKDGQIASVGSEPIDGKFRPYVLTNVSYKNAKKTMYSTDNTYAFAQFDDDIKIISFGKPDTLSQVEARLPLEGSRVGTITWNATASDYAGAANSQIVYDKKDGETWNLIQSDIQGTKPSILMSLDPNRFSNIYLDWGQNAKKVLIAGGELGVLDLGTRIYEKINEKISFKWGVWGPKGKYAVAIDDKGDSYVLSDLKVKKLDLKTAPDLISWTSPNKAIIISEGRPVGVDFDTMSRINYAEINALENATSFGVIGGRAVFADNIGIKVAPLTENIYK